MWIVVKPRDWCLGLGPIDSVWIAVNTKRERYGKLLKDSDGV